MSADEEPEGQWRKHPLFGAIYIYKTQSLSDLTLSEYFGPICEPPDWANDSVVGNPVVENELLAPPSVPVQSGQWRWHPFCGAVYIDGPSRMWADSWSVRHPAIMAGPKLTAEVESWPICEKPEWVVAPVLEVES